MISSSASPNTNHLCCAKFVRFLSPLTRVLARLRREGWLGGAPFEDTWGAMTKEGIRKPVWRAFQALHQSGDRLLNASITAAAGSGEEDALTAVSAFATVESGGSGGMRGLQLFAANFWPQQGASANSRTPVETTVDVQLTTAPSEAIPRTAFLWRIDDNVTAPAGAWERMGSPKYLTPLQLAELQQASEMSSEEVSVAVAPDGARLSFSLPPYGVGILRFDGGEHYRTAHKSDDEPWPAADTECAVRQLAFTFGATLLRGTAGDGNARLARSLALGGNRSGGCAIPSVPTRLHRETPVAASGQQWFVDAANGSDSNSGRALDRPFRSLSRARSALRQTRAGGNTVWIRGGTYWQAEPFRLSVEDSGRDGAPNMWSAFGNESVVLSGGVPLTGLTWTRCPRCNDGVWQAALPANAPHSDSFNSLFVNGRREVRARWPDQGTNPTPQGMSSVDPATSSSGYLVDPSAFAMQCFPTDAVALVPTIDVVDPEGVLVSAGTDSAAGPRWPAGYCGLQGAFCGSDPHARNISVEWPASKAQMKNDQDYWTGFVCAQNVSSCAVSRFDLRNNAAPYWSSNQRPGITNWSTAPNRSWASPHTGILHQVHPAGWGSWQFQLAQRTKAAALQPGLQGDALVFACKVLSGTDSGKVVPCPETWVDKARVNPCKPPFNHSGCPDAVTHEIQGGWQEGRGWCDNAFQHANDGTPPPGWKLRPARTGHGFFVENIFEELTAEREWFADVAPAQGAERYLYYHPEEGVNPNSLTFVASNLSQVVQLVGDSISSPVHDVAIAGVTVAHAATTFMQRFEIPSGGDWSVHRGASVVLESAERIDLQGLHFDQPGGNGLLLSKHVASSTVSACTFVECGESAIISMGKTRLLDGRDGRCEVPRGNRFVGNLVDGVGAFGKQSAAYFHAKSRDALLEGNVFLNGPRSAVNLNDGYAGNDTIRGNLMLAFVKESADHGPINTWDRVSGH